MQTLFLIFRIALCYLIDDKINQDHDFDSIVAVFSVFELKTFPVGNGDDVKFHSGRVVGIGQDLLEVDVGCFYFSLGILLAKKL